MKKSVRKVTALVLTFLMVVAMLPAMGKVKNVKAEETTYHAFVGIGAEAEATKWDMCYSGPANGELAGATVEEADMKVGDTATISITLPKQSVKVWWMAPCLVVDAGKTVDVTVNSLKIDGQEVKIDKSKYETLTWYEGTGDNYKDNCVRTYGGYNEWGVQDGIVIPEGAQKIEYTITLNSVLDKDSYLAFIALGGDSAKEGASWDYSYAGPASADNTEGVVATTAAVKVGETATISVTFPDTFKHAYYVTPAIIIPEAGEKTKVDAVVTSVKVDGQDVAFDLSKKDATWQEDTGAYSKKTCYRINGGYNEWDDNRAIAAFPENFKTVEFTFTLKSVELEAVEKEVVDFKGVLDLHIAFGGDKDAKDDWGYGYTAGYSKDPKPVEETIQVGETKTVSLEFSKNVIHAYYFAPYLSSEIESLDGLVVDIDITCKINGQEVAIDAKDKKVCWNEKTGEIEATNAVRLMGGHNDWGDSYVTVPEEGIKTLEYTITLKSASIEREVVKEFDKALLDKEYNGYLIFQCPDTWVFRDDWTNETNGLLGYKDGVNDYFTHVTWNEGATEEEKNLGGTCTDAVITGNGKYSVKIEGFKEGLAGSTAWNMLYVSLDMPYDCVDRGGVTITDAVVLIDGKKQNVEALITKGDKVDSKNHPEINGVYTGIQFINKYNSENPNGQDSVNIPQKSIEIQFTIAGLAKDAAPTETPAEPTKAPAEDKNDTPAPTQAPAEPTKAPASEKANNPTPIIIVAVVCAVVLVGAVVAIVVVRKKKVTCKI